MSKLTQNLKGDKVIWAVVFFLSLFSVLAVYSSTGTLAYKNKAGNTEYYLIKHFFILVLGLVLMYLAHKPRYTIYAKFSFIAIVLSVCLLGYTLLFGSNINEANRWLTLPVINLNFQTSDIAKLALIIYLSKIISNRQENIKDFKKGFGPVIAPVVIICLLIMPANFSTAAILFATCLILMFVGRVSTKHILYLIGVMVLAGGLLVVILMNSPKKSRLGTWSNRLETFFGDEKKQDPNDLYQINQSKIAVATGGWFGKFPGNSTQRNMLPQAYSDFIFAIIVEEYGIIGGIFVILLYCILLFRGIRIATQCERNFGTLLGLGISFILVFQAMINMAIVVDIFPVTGQPLPLLSMGGTSIWFTSIAIGILLSISKDNEERLLASQKETIENTGETEHATA